MQKRHRLTYLIVGICGIIILAMSLVFCINYYQLQSVLNSIAESDTRNKGIDVSVHYKSYIIPSILIYDIKFVSLDNSMADVFRMFLQFADKMQSRKIEIVELCYKGKAKFKIKGIYFHTLGKEYSSQNQIYTIRTFPENLFKPDGSKAYPEWTGGWLGVMLRQMENFNEFHKKWWLEDKGDDKRAGVGGLPRER